MFLQFKTIEDRLKLLNLPFDDGGGGGGGGGSGGGGGTGGGTTAANGGAISIINITSSGGLAGASYLLGIPVFDVIRKVYYVVAPNGDDFDCEDDVEYFFRVEDTKGQKVSVRRVRITYRNIGRCRITVGIQSTNTSAQQTLILGDPNIANGCDIGPLEVNDGQLYNAYADLMMSEVNPQLYIKRAGNDGPMSIIDVTLIGEGQELSQ